MTWFDVGVMLVKVYMTGLIAAFVCGFIGAIVVAMLSKR